MKWRIRADKYGDRSTDIILDCSAPAITETGAYFYGGPDPDAPVGVVVESPLLAHFKEWVFIVRELEEP